MRLLLFIFLALQSFISVGQTQTEMNMQAAEQYKLADKELNKVYKDILSRNVADTIFIKNLKTAQRLWTKFRDAELKTMYPEREPRYYGSIHPYVYPSTLQNLPKSAPPN
jgi:uncharacterized protein YecT (DUF1311 family)